jgi:hypothetical protein
VRFVQNRDNYPPDEAHAPKAPDQPRRHTIEAGQSVGGLLVDRLKRAALTARSRQAVSGHR